MGFFELTGKWFSSGEGIDAGVLAGFAINDALNFDEASWNGGVRFGCLNRRGNRGVVSRMGRWV